MISAKDMSDVSDKAKRINENKTRREINKIANDIYKQSLIDIKIAAKTRETQTHVSIPHFCDCSKYRMLKDDICERIIPKLISMGFSAQWDDWRDNCGHQYLSIAIDWRNANDK